MKDKLKMALHNRFDIEILDTVTDEVKQVAYAENIILDQAWAQIVADGVQWFTQIFVGTGTGTIVATRTSLFTQLVARACTEQVWNSSAADNWYSLRQKIVLTEAEFVGASITELGVGNGTLCTHAMLKDMNGNQVALTKTDTDIITVYATVYLRVPAFDKTGGVNLIRYAPGENPIICTLLGRFITIEPEQYGGWTLSTLAAYISASKYPSESSEAYALTWLTRTFDSANKKLTLYHRIPAASANVGGLKSYMIYSGGYSGLFGYSNYRAGLLFRATKSQLTQATVTEQIGVGDSVKTAFKTAFPFVKSGAIVKVDGISASHTLVYDAPNKKDIKEYMYNLGITGYGEKSLSDAFPFGANIHTLLLENPFYSLYGIDSIVASDITLFTSDDMITWVQAYTGTGTYEVAAEHKQKRYWKCVSNASGEWSITSININAFDALNNIVFATAPATGAIITAEYDTDLIAKDVNHVYDITVVLQLGEYIP